MARQLNQQQSFQEVFPISPNTDLRSVESGGIGVNTTTGLEGWNSRVAGLAVNEGNGVMDATQISESEPPPENPKEMRYATMLHLLESKPVDLNNDPKCSTSKLISGTNPLSALLRRDLKEKIVNNSCPFRTPDPALGAPRQISRRGMGVHNCNWEQHYRSMGVPEAKMQYLVAIGCFQLPSPNRCSELLETYFSHVHPILPVIDRKDFLARYYGLDDPPPLVVLHAVFLAASRYANDDQPPGKPSEIRSQCDLMHTKLHALVETDICSERVAIIQATLLASLHWEGREGLNSAIDNLSLAVRAGQEMGLHRKTSIAEDRNTTKNKALLRRLWWSTFAFDRLNAAQEGTPFLINEMDCDVETLTEDDFQGEDTLTSQTTMLNLSLACLIQDTVRSLYAAGEDPNTLFSTRGILARQRLTLQLEQLASRVSSTLLPKPDPGMSFQADAMDDIRRLWCAILLTHIDAVRILVHRPFITFPEPNNPGTYFSRDSCRVHALDIVSRLSLLQSQNTLRFSWPFTVYAVVNCLLIFWYDLSSPPTNDRSAQSKARQNYATVVRLLKEMGITWWAAAAKHKLAEALARAAGELQAREERSLLANDLQTQNMPAAEKRESLQYQQPPTPLSAGNPNEMDMQQWSDDNLFGTDNAAYWSSIGLDFDADVAGNIFSIFQSGGSF